MAPSRSLVTDKQLHSGVTWEPGAGRAMNGRSPRASSLRTLQVAARPAARRFVWSLGLTWEEPKKPAVRPCESEGSLGLPRGGAAGEKAARDRKRNRRLVLETAAFRTGRGQPGGQWGAPLVQGNGPRRLSLLRLGQSDRRLGWERARGAGRLPPGTRGSSKATSGPPATAALQTPYRAHGGRVRAGCPRGCSGPAAAPLGLTWPHRQG